MCLSSTPRISGIAGLEQLSKWLVTGEGRGERTGIDLAAAFIRMIVQRNHDPFAGNHVIPAIRLVVEYLFPPYPPVEPPVDVFQYRFTDVLKVAVLFKDP